jgi:TIGR03009 family protein
MRWIARMAAAVLVMTSPAWGQQAPPKPAAGQDAAAQGKAQAAGTTAQLDQAGLDQLLARWEQRSSEMKTLDAQFRRKDDLATLGDVEYYQGRAMLKSPNLVVLQFSRTDEEFKKPVLEERIVCTADEVWQFGYKLKQIVIHTLDQDQKRRALQQGPAAFLFNMKAADAKRRYDMTAWEDPNNQRYHIKIVPRLPEDRENSSRPA